LAEITEGYVGSDLESIAREAAIQALRENDDAEEIGMAHFREALEDVRPTVTDDIREYFEQMEEDFKGGTRQPERQRGSGRIGFQ
ncbi:MAG: ATPase, partial [Halorhabdus sp.]